MSGMRITGRRQQSHDEGRISDGESLGGTRYYYQAITTPEPHIRVVAPPEDYYDTEESTTLEPFVQRESLHAEVAYLQDRRPYELSSIRDSSTSLTFAEIVANMHRPRGSDRTSDGATDMSGSGTGAPPTSDATARPSSRTSRVSLQPKKPKKWHRLDLEWELGSGSGVGVSVSGIRDSESITAQNSPSPSSSRENSSPHGSSSFERSQDLSFQDPDEPREKGKGRAIVDTATEITPSRQSISSSRSQPHAHTLSNTSERSLIHQQDPPHTKQQISGIMSRIDDVFDIKEWDDEPQAHESDNSPEPLTAKPQPVEYTTVGSVVKANSTPQFTAPIRIQREGANRRLPLQLPPLTTPRGSDNYYMRNQGMHPSPSFNYGSQSQPSRIPHYSQQQSMASTSHSMSDIQKEALRKSLGLSPPLRSDNVSNVTPRLDPRSDPFISSTTSDFTAGRGLVRNQNSNQTAHTQGPPPGLSKMQTLTRLAQFENPVQHYARDRLSQFAAPRDAQTRASTESAHTHTGLAQPADSLLGSFSGYPPEPLAQGVIPHEASYTRSTYSDPSLPHAAYGGRDAHNSRSDSILPELQAQTEALKRACIDYETRILPTISGDASRLGTNQFSSATHSSPGYNFSDSSGSSQFGNIQSQFQGGYPQPLTAGPPGLRNPPGLSRPLPARSLNTTSPQDLMPISQQSSLSTTHQSTVLPSQTIQEKPKREFSTRPENNIILNTSSLEDVAKYYPNGFEPGMKNNFTPMDSSTRQLYLGGVVEKTEKELKEQRTNDFFYGGLRRFSMTAEEHLREMEEREWERRTGRKLDAPYEPPTMEERTVLTAHEINKMSEAECAAPLLDAAFGTLLAYADKAPGPNNRSKQSNFESSSPPWCIDHSRHGNDSFFGEFGQTPRGSGSGTTYVTGNGKKLSSSY